MEQTFDDVDLLALQDVGQLLELDPGACGAFAGGAGEQSGQAVELGVGEVFGFFEERPSQALEFGFVTLFDASGPVEGLTGLGDDMELVEGDFGVGQMFGDALDIGARHVDGGGFDAFGVAAAPGEVGGEALNGVGAAALVDEHHASGLGVGHQGDIVVPLGAGGLVDGDGAQPGQVVGGDGKLDVTRADRDRAMPGQAGQAGDGRERHLPAQAHDERLEQQREAGRAARPGRLHQRHAAVRQPHPGHPGLEHALVLEEVQMPVALELRVVDRMRPLAVREAAAAPEIHLDRQPLFGFCRS